MVIPLLVGRAGSLGAIEAALADDRWIFLVAQRDGVGGVGAGEEGFGSRLVEMSIAGPLGGKWERRFERDGLICELTVAKAALEP